MTNKLRRCNCEHGDCHPNSDCPKPAGLARAEHIGAVCDDCAPKYREYLWRNEYGVEKERSS